MISGGALFVKRLRRVVSFPGRERSSNRRDIMHFVQVRGVSAHTYIKMYTVNYVSSFSISFFLFHSLTMWRKMVYHRTGEAATYFRRLRENQKTVPAPVKQPNPFAAFRRFKRWCAARSDFPGALPGQIRNGEA